MSSRRIVPFPVLIDNNAVIGLTNHFELIIIKLWVNVSYLTWCILNLKKSEKLIGFYTMCFLTLIFKNQT